MKPPKKHLPKISSLALKNSLLVNFKPPKKSFVPPREFKSGVLPPPLFWALHKKKIAKSLAPTGPAIRLQELQK